MSDLLIEIEVDAAFHSYVEAARIRAMALAPGITIVFETPKVLISAPSDWSPEKLRGDFLDTLYREKIYAETLPLRKRICGV